MKIGDLVTFCPEAWGTPLEDRPLGVVVQMGVDSSVSQPDWDKGFRMVTVLFPTDDIPYSSKARDFEVVNEDW